MVVKPTLARGFNYKNMHWADLPQVHTAQVTLAQAEAWLTFTSVSTHPRR
jgi:hypothetical protein